MLFLVRHTMVIPGSRPDDRANSGPAGIYTPMAAVVDMVHVSMASIGYLGSRLNGVHQISLE